MRNRIFFGTLAALVAAVDLTGTSVTTAHAHELAENRATLVQRDASHVSVTLFIALPEVLHQVLAAERSFQEFVLAYAAMPQANFQAALLKAQRQLQSELWATTKNDQRLMLTSWVWPEAARVQAALQEHAMQALVAPRDHRHTSALDALEIRAELHSTKPITSLRVQFPPAFKRVMTVSYRPKQVWVEMHRPSPVITFE